MLFPALKPMGRIWIFILLVSSACYCANVKKYEFKQVLVITFYTMKWGVVSLRQPCFICVKGFTQEKKYGIVFL